MSKIICIVSPSTSNIQRSKILSIFFKFGSLNVAIVHVPSADKIYYEILEIDNTLTELVNPNDSSLIFPDKLVDFKHTKVYVAVHHQPPSVKVQNKTIKAPMKHFLLAIDTILNVNF